MLSHFQWTKKCSVSHMSSANFSETHSHDHSISCCKTYDAINNCSCLLVELLSCKPGLEQRTT